MRRRCPRVRRPGWCSGQPASRLRARWSCSSCWEEPMAALPADPLAWKVRLLSGLVLLVIFVAGGLSGVGLTRWLAPPLPGPPPLLHEYRQLGLSPEQET